MALVAVCLLLFMFLLRRRHKRNAARLAEEREQRLQLAALREAQAAEEAAARGPIRTVIPVVIVQPDGEVLIANIAQQLVAPPDGSGDGGGDGKALQPKRATSRPGSRRERRRPGDAQLLQELAPGFPEPQPGLQM